MATTQDDRITDLQRAIAELRQERDTARAERDAALAQRDSDYGERIEHQSATIDVLKVMSASPGDAQPVFELIVERARDLCDAYGASVWEYDGTLIHLRASNGVSDDPEVKQAVEAIYPMVPSRERAVGRAILDRQIIRIDDYDADLEISPAMKGITVKSTVLIPLMREGEPIGGLGVGSRERGGFSVSQIELMKTFAEQAVIAISSAETYRALQSRTADLQELLEYQTATSDVLKVISRSTFDLQPVLDTVVQTAARLCDADQVIINRLEGEGWLTVANFGFPPEFEAYLRNRAITYPPNAASVAARASREGRPVHIHDVTTVPSYPDGLHHSGQATNVTGRTAVARRTGDRNPRSRAPEGRAFHRSADRSCQHLCRSGGDRHREQSADHRAARGVGAADCDRRGVTDHQRVTRRPEAGIRRGFREGNSAV